MHGLYFVDDRHVSSLSAFIAESYSIQTRKFVHKNVV